MRCHDSRLNVNDLNALLAVLVKLYSVTIMLGLRLVWDHRSMCGFPGNAISTGGRTLALLVISSGLNSQIHCSL